MPYINIRLGCTLSPEQKKKINQKTTQLMNQVMGKNAEVTVIHDIPANSWGYNGKTQQARADLKG